MRHGICIFHRVFSHCIRIYYVFVAIYRHSLYALEQTAHTQQPFCLITQVHSSLYKHIILRTAKQHLSTRFFRCVVVVVFVPMFSERLYTFMMICCCCVCNRFRSHRFEEWKNNFPKRIKRLQFMVRHTNKVK